LSVPSISPSISSHKRRAAPAPRAANGKPDLSGVWMHEIDAFIKVDVPGMEIGTQHKYPQMYTKPFAIKVLYELLADSDIFENFCNENEKDRAHIGQK
jgi:hypothetical protein